MSTKKKGRTTAFVPRLLVHGVIAGVVPACALVGCGGGVAGSDEGGTDGGLEGGADVFRGVAAVAYPAYESGAPDGGLDAEAGAESGADSNGQDTGIDVFHGVAAVAYPAYEAGTG
jgi:hypothetical protein